MDNSELKSLMYEYVVDLLSYEDYHNFGSPEKFHKWVDENYEPIKKSNLIKGQIYDGICRNASRATWDGEKFHYERTKFRRTYDEVINHYEDDDGYGYDVFVPIKRINDCD